jgi:hypothetical protein
MGQLFSLGDYRSRRVEESKSKPPHKPHSEDAGLDARPTYYCMACGHDEFALYPSGAVHCAHCCALMDNLGVVSRRDQQTK